MPWDTILAWSIAIFGRDDAVDTAQLVARACLIFVYGLVLVRLAGRRVFGRWSALDIIVSIVVGSNLSRALTGNAPLLGTWPRPRCFWCSTGSWHTRRPGGPLSPGWSKVVP